MAYSVLFNMCLSDLRLRFYMCEYACLHLVGEANVCCSSLSTLCESTLCSMPPLLLSATDLVCIRITRAESNGSSYSSWPSLNSHTLTMSLISHTLRRWCHAFPPTFLFLLFSVIFFFKSKVKFSSYTFHFVNKLESNSVHTKHWLETKAYKSDVNAWLRIQGKNQNIPCKAKPTGNMKTGELENMAQTKWWQLGFKSKMLSLEVLLSNVAAINEIQFLNYIYNLSTLNKTRTIDIWPVSIRK